MANFKKPGTMWSLVIVLAAVLIGAGCLTNGIGDTAQAGVNDEITAEDAAAAADADAGGSESSENEVVLLIKPTGGEITANFGENPITGYSHTGIDFAGNVGDPVVAAADGKVAEAGFDAENGNCIRLVHDNGMETVYGHLSEMLVDEGDEVAAGEQIGAVGQTGQATGACLHFELIAGGEAVNPQENFN